MTTLAVRATTQATTGTTWANTANAVDGLVGVNNATYATMTSTTSGAVATIELSGFGFSSSIASTDTLTSVDLTFRHFENNTGRFASVAYQAYDGATAIGSSNNATLVTSAATVGPATVGCTLAQLRSSTFKIRITITGASSTQSRVFSLDWVDVSVIYTIAPPSITQAAYGFYADGTETGATAYSLTTTLADSYTEVGAISDAGLGETGSYTRYGQSFLGNGQALSQAGFYLFRQGSPVGNVTAALFAHTGTYGTSSRATGTALATSTTTVAAASMSTSASWVNFDFDPTYTLVNGTAYVIAVEATGLGTAGNVVRVKVNNTTPTHAGNQTLYLGSWGWSDTVDVPFRVYTSVYTADTSSGDVNLQVRTRLQSTTAVAVPTTDDWQLQYQRNTNGIWTSLGATEAAPDSNIVAACTSQIGLQTGRTGTGQSFKGNGRNLTSAVFWLSKTGTPAATTVTAYLYAHTGTYGSATTGKGTGSPLATSTNTVAVTSLTVAATPTTKYTFDFDGTFTLADDTPYVMLANVDVTGDASNFVVVGTAFGPAGNASNLAAGVWTAASADVAAEVYTPAGTVAPYASANLTDGAATTNRLGAGTGSFVAGKISEDGLVDDLGWSANNYTELLYSVTLKQADLTPTDTVRFRVLRNAATTDMTYTQVPTITIGTAGPTDRTGTATGSLTVGGSALGVRDTLGAATGTLTIAGSAAGVITQNVVGTAAGTLTVSGVATGLHGVTGTATGTLSVAGEATGLKVTVATATGTLTVAGAAVGVRDTRGVATATLTVAGVATGTKTVTATATGTLTVAGVATGSKTVTATATGALTVSGVATGLHGIEGQATGTLAVSGTAVGAKTVTGQATGTVAVSGVATAVKTVTGAATGQIAITSIALGLVEGNAVGTATGQITVGGAAVGVRATTGQATGQLSIGGTASGVRGVTATATGVLTVVALAVAARTVRGVATGTITVYGHAVGAGASEYVGFQLWDGATFVDGEVRLWTGAAFAGAEGVKVWDGTAFVDS